MESVKKVLHTFYRRNLGQPAFAGLYPDCLSFSTAMAVHCRRRMLPKATTLRFPFEARRLWFSYGAVRRIAGFYAEEVTTFSRPGERRVAVH